MSEARSTKSNDLERNLGLGVGRAARRGSQQRSAVAARRFAERAARDGEAEIAYAPFESPIGEGTIAATKRGIVLVSLPGEDREQRLEDLAERLSPRVVEAPGSLAEPLRELDQYFSGTRHDFDLTLDWRLVDSPFRRGVLEATARVPYGTTITYGDAAEQAGNRRAHRAAGTALGANPLPLIVPCHRVIRAGGVLGNYGGGPAMKRWLLRMEGAID
ncbi:methylated-DNA--[protein]-cysteine S-methyltransferase [soil metagenome]